MRRLPISRPVVVHLRILALVFAAGALSCAALFLLLLAARVHTG